MASSPVHGLYDTAQDRDSAFEKLQARAVAKQAEVEAPPARTPADSPWGDTPDPEPRTRTAPRPRASSRQSMGEAFAKSLLRSVGSQVGREIMRGVLGSLRRR